VATNLAAIRQADEFGVPTVWLPMPPLGLDPLTLIAGAAAHTRRVRLATGIVPTYPRHPAVLASQAMVAADLLPDRFVLGIGASHPFIVHGMYGVPAPRPLAHLREYVTVLRRLLEDGVVDHTGESYSVHGQLWPGAGPTPVPIAIAAVRPRMFELAGEIGDAAVAAWCPVPYLRDTALPAMRAGAERAGRPTPALVASLDVAYHPDRGRAETALRQALALYQPVPAYTEMFALAGHDVRPDQPVPAELVEQLLVYGDDAAIVERIRSAHAAGIDDVMVHLLPVEDPMTEQTGLLRLLGSVQRAATQVTP
jgi:alkanesulfonate monooxygenase SsuD/methylene tetrahydromethanopterin reductase-like flavin-dependent oxidoreductase (luciferase family)